jgi:hypothetical protein
MDKVQKHNSFNNTSMSPRHLYDVMVRHWCNSVLCKLEESKNVLHVTIFPSEREGQSYFRTAPSPPAVAREKNVARDTVLCRPPRYYLVKVFMIRTKSICESVYICLLLFRFYLTKM